MGYYKDRIKELRKKLLFTTDKNKRTHYKLLIKNYKSVIADKTRRN